MSLLDLLLPARWRHRRASGATPPVEIKDPMASLLLLIPGLLLSVPWNTIVPLAEEVLTGKASRDELVATIPHVLDDAIDFDVLLPGAVGAVLEHIDGDLEARAVSWIADHAIVKARRKLASSSPATAIARKPGSGFFGKLLGRHVEPATT